MSRMLSTLLLLAFAIQASAADIVGKVTIPAAPEEELSESAREQDRQSVAEPYSDAPRTAVAPAASAPIGSIRDVVVYLEEAPADAKSPAHPPLVLAQKNKHFIPRVLAVPVGSAVEFPNNDGFFHNVFSLSRPKKFDLGRYKNGESRQVVFDKPGVVKIFCEIHSQMKATILVVPNGFYTSPDDRGSFVLKDVPPGKYNLVAWHPSRPLQLNPVIVPAGGNARVAIDF